LTVKKSPADAVHDTELDDRDAKHDVGCEEQQRADDGDKYGADAHVKYFLFVLSSCAAAREQVGELRSETEFCAGTLRRNSRFRDKYQAGVSFLRAARILERMNAA
jgi:hypothetical protein